MPNQWAFHPKSKFAFFPSFHLRCPDKMKAWNRLFLDESLWESPFSSVYPLGWDTAVGGPWPCSFFYSAVMDPRMRRWTMWGLHLCSVLKCWIQELVTCLGIGASAYGVTQSRTRLKWLSSSLTLEMSVNLSDSDPVSLWPTPRTVVR